MTHGLTNPKFMLLHVSVNKPSSRSLLPCFAKVLLNDYVNNHNFSKARQ